jgi:hypothetical protein
MRKENIRESRATIVHYRLTFFRLGFLILRTGTTGEGPAEVEVAVIDNVFDGGGTTVSRASSNAGEGMAVLRCFFRAPFFNDLM